jgi:hypothetical protein
MEGVSRTIYHGQSQNRSRDFGSVQYFLFDPDFVVMLVNPSKYAPQHLYRFWRIEPTSGPDWRALCEGQRL